MVYIKKIEIKGFKSFGNRALSLPLDEGFVALTGPNGSGKSNLLDAVSFCLGENSPKSLRVGRLTSLLYDSSEASGSVSAKVTLYFDNSSRKIPVDSDTVTVTRELKHTGESTYYLNSKRIMKNALLDILELALISSGSLNIISQGMITRLSELMPEEKRRILEEVTGVAQFDDKKAEAQVQLKEADQKLQVALARIGEVRNRITSLEEERNEQLRLKQLEDEIRWLKATVASRDLLALRERLKSSNEGRKQKESEIRETQADLRGIKDEMSGLESERSEFMSTVMDGEGGKQVELQFSIGRTSSEIERQKDLVGNAQTSLKRADEALPQLKRMLDEHAESCTQSEERVGALLSQISEFESRRDSIEKDMSSTQRNLNRARKALEKKTGEQERARQNLLRLSDQINAQRAEIDLVRGRASLNGEKLSTTKEKSADFLSTLENLDSNIKALEGARDSENDSLKSLTESINESEALRNNLQKELEAALETLETAGKRLVSYESQSDIVGKIVGEDTGRGRILELSQSGAVEGIMGNLEDVISFDAKYEAPVRAISQRWNNAILCKDIPSMVKVITLGKKLKVPRFVLIPLSEIEGSGRTSPPIQDGVLGNLADHISAPKWASGLINFIFGDTLLVDSASTAYLLSTSGKRTVTTGGDIFEPGSSIFETGYLTTIEAIVKQIPEEGSLTNIRTALDSLRSSISKRKSTLTQMDAKASDLSHDNLKQSISVEKISVELRSLKQFLARYSRLRRELENQLKRLSSEGDRLGKRLKRLEVGEQGMQARINRYEEKADPSYTQSLSDEMRKLDETRISLETSLEEIAINLREKITEQTKESANLEQIVRPNFDRLKEQILNFENEETSSGKIKLESSEKIGALQQELTTLRKEERTLLESSKKSRPILEAIEKKLEAVRRRERSVDDRMRSMERDLISIEKEEELITEGENRLLGEITLYGFAEPVETFEGSDELLKAIGDEYEDLRLRVNLLADSQYSEIYSGYKNLSVRRNQLDDERSSIIRFIEDVESEKKSVFLTSFEKIDSELRTIFEKLTGGSAWLELEKPDDIFSGGTYLMTQFPGKVPRESTSVSGGEKSVSAVSFLLAIQSVYPSPFYLFDEIDAHLDVVNAERLADILKERATSQIILVTLKDAMIVRAGVVYGFYATNGVSQIVRYKPDIEVKPAAV